MSDIFHFEEGRPSFEDHGVPNGTRTWLATDLFRFLGYQSDKSAMQVITRAMQACLSLGIRTEENFIPHEGSYKLTRFACYLVAMNGDPKKPEVAAAQAYFAALAESFESHAEHANALDRVLVRDEMTTGMKALDSTAKKHGVENYAFFLNAGYRGMYNMDLNRLSDFKGVPPRERLLDRMGKTELAANLFRVTQTDDKIKNQSIRGQRGLEGAAYDVGRTVRETMMKISGKPPEHLAIAPHIKDVKRELKAASKNLKQLDAPKKKAAKKKGPKLPPTETP